MFDIKEFYSKQNEASKKSFLKSREVINMINRETAEYSGTAQKKEYYRFFNYLSSFILKMLDLEANLIPDYFQKKTLEDLWNDNKSFYHEITVQNYKTSYANPAYAVSLFGDDYGQLMATFFYYYRNLISFAFKHKIFKFAEYNELFIKVYQYFRDNEPDYPALMEIITSIRSKDRTEDISIDFNERLNPEFQFNLQIVENFDLSDLRYLFRYGEAISEVELKSAAFFQQYPEDKLKQLAYTVVKAYITGFERDEKDISHKSTVNLNYNIGQERLIREVVNILKDKGLTALLFSPASTSVNKQYPYDYRFENALYLDEKTAERLVSNYKNACERNKNLFSQYSGIIVFSKFGEPPFSPQKKQESLKLSEKQQKLFQVYQNSIMKIYDEYAPRRECSFTIISFPSPEIGSNFEAIFEDILEVNLLDTDKYEPIQQKIIDALDKADYVVVKGKSGNRTDIRVKMQAIPKPQEQTNFVNCGADVNIPVGEVFTSPQLNGTEGILHVQETYLKGLKYIDLELSFKDGYVTKYTCSNFDTEEDNLNYIRENLLFPHQTLPIGEFAIGTNTLAYVTARKHKIVPLLPVLIIEKMGPHFAVGDTCFTMEEDKPVFNHLDHKEIIARENEKTALRKTDPQNAYTFIHTDITLPYDSIGLISAITPEGDRIDIIRDGRFVLPGTEELNIPLDTIDY
ncbi:aminopeptidase [bacterium]|nr:aminopeptidase [bacterium]